MSKLNLHLEDRAKYFMKGKAEIELALDSDLPDVDDAVAQDVNEGIGQLLNEIRFYGRPTKVRFKTSQDPTQIYIELAWNVGALDERVLQRANAAYDKGMASEIQIFQGGSFTAGHYIGRNGGNLVIENFNDPIYSVRNMIVLPK